MNDTTQTGEIPGPKYPHIQVQLSDRDGNAFAIMARVSRALRREGVPSSEVNAYTSESLRGDYDHMIQTAMKWVDVW